VHIKIAIAKTKKLQQTIKTAQPTGMQWMYKVMRAIF
jgi:hypothetical protein